MTSGACVWPCSVLARRPASLAARAAEASAPAPAAAGGSPIAQARASAALHLCRGDTPAAALASRTRCSAGGGPPAPALPCHPAATLLLCHELILTCETTAGQPKSRLFFYYFYFFFKKRGKNPGEFHRPRLACQHRAPELAPLKQGNSQHRLGKSWSKWVNAGGRERLTPSLPQCLVPWLAVPAASTTPHLRPLPPGPAGGRSG